MFLALVVAAVLFALIDVCAQLRAHNTITRATGADRVDTMINEIARILATRSDRNRIQGRAARMAATHGAKGRSVAFLVSAALVRVRAQSFDLPAAYVTGLELQQ